MSFLKPQVAKRKISASEASVRRLFDLGWIAQVKFRGKRAQVHIPPDDAVRAYTGTGQLHSRPIPDEVDEALHAWFGSSTAISVLDCEWCQQEGRLYIVDALRLAGESLRALTFPERQDLLFRHFIHPAIKIAPVFKTPGAAVKSLHAADPLKSGLVFRSTTIRGWPDSAVVRCPT